MAGNNFISGRVRFYLAASVETPYSLDYESRFTVFAAGS
jgi:hypothetical protein